MMVTYARLAAMLLLYKSIWLLGETIMKKDKKEKNKYERKKFKYFLKKVFLQNKYKLEGKRKWRYVLSYTINCKVLCLHLHIVNDEGGKCMHVCFCSPVYWQKNSVLLFPFISSFELNWSANNWWYRCLTIL